MLKLNFLARSIWYKIVMFVTLGRIVSLFCTPTLLHHLELYRNIIIGLCQHDLGGNWKGQDIQCKMCPRI